MIPTCGQRCLTCQSRRREPPREYWRQPWAEERASPVRRASRRGHAWLGP